MSLWNFGGLNPKHKDFVGRYPDKTMLGMAWAYYWRFSLFLTAIYLAIFIIFAVLAIIVGVFSR